LYAHMNNKKKFKKRIINIEDTQKMG
jgi:hypothetical protein